MALQTNCLSCKYFATFQGYQICRRFPPDPKFPSVGDMTICGEHQDYDRFVKFIADAEIIRLEMALVETLRKAGENIKDGEKLSDEQIALAKELQEPTKSDVPVTQNVEADAIKAEMEADAKLKAEILQKKRKADKTVLGEVGKVAGIKVESVGFTESFNID